MAKLGTIDFKPTIESTESYFKTFLSWIVEGTNEVKKLEADLVPFMNIEKNPVYELNSQNEILPWAQE